MVSGSIGAVLGLVGGALRQQAYVVTDIGEAKESMRRSFGCAKFFEFESTAPWELRGRTVQCDLAVAFGRSGNLQVELIQPLRGEGVHFELLEARGAGLHHLGFYVDDLGGYDEVAAACAGHGFPPVMSGGLGPSRFCYLDTIETLGVYVELISDPGNSMMKMMPWWDDPVR